MMHFEARCCRAQRAAAIRRIATKFFRGAATGGAARIRSALETRFGSLTPQPRQSECPRAVYHIGERRERNGNNCDRVGVGNLRRAHQDGAAD